MLAFVYLSIGSAATSFGVYLTFALCSRSAAAIAIFELFLMHEYAGTLGAACSLAASLACAHQSRVFVRMQFLACAAADCAAHAVSPHSQPLPHRRQPRLSRSRRAQPIRV
jgi:hypothetical protein